MRRTQEFLKNEIIEYRVYQENEKWFGFRFCPECKKEIKHEAQESYLVLRNIRDKVNKKTLCLVCAKLGDKNSFFGKKHSEESKLQNSESRAGKACGSENAMANPEYRKRVSIALKTKYDSGELDYQKEIQRQSINKSRSEGKIINNRISIAEKEVVETFKNKGFLVDTQFKIETKQYDLFLSEHNTIIEYNGNYWHCNPEKYALDYFNKKKDMFAWQIWEYDLKKKELAEKNGYKLFIIWEKDYMFNKEVEINKIITQL